MTEKQPIPTNYVSKDDLLYSRPDLREKIAALNTSDIEIIADKIGDALQETYWLAVDIILEDYLTKNTPSSNNK
jgi:hypothetical protein